MSSAVDNPSSAVDAPRNDAAAPGGRRRNDAQASRRALLDAASALFDERGYQGATLRDIGERAGVDPALIARYFGGKEGLYLAALDQVDPSPSADPHEVFARLLAKSEHGTADNPICLAMVSPALSEGLREQIRAMIDRRLVQPLSQQLAGAGVDRPALRAELLVAVAIGVTLTRSGGTLAALSESSLAELHDVLDPLVTRLAGEGGR
jgi:AcrR family transcriptional regulator